MLALKKVSDESQEQLVRNLSSDHSLADIGPADLAMLDYALKLTRTPGRMSPEDVEILRGHGFDDRAVHDLCAVTSYFAFLNRIADGLGVELEQQTEGE